MLLRTEIEFGTCCHCNQYAVHGLVYLGPKVFTPLNFCLQYCMVG